jgi:hypothetical protein
MPNSTNISKDSFIFSVNYFFEKNNFTKIPAYIFRIFLYRTCYLVMYIQKQCPTLIQMVLLFQELLFEEISDFIVINF